MKLSSIECRLSLGLDFVKRPLYSFCDYVGATLQKDSGLVGSFGPSEIEL